MTSALLTLPIQTLGKKGFARAKGVFKSSVSTDCVATAAAYVNIHPSKEEEEQNGVAQSV